MVYNGLLGIPSWESQTLDIHPLAQTVRDRVVRQMGRACFVDKMRKLLI